MPTPEEIRAVVNAYVDGYNRVDREAVVGLFAPDAELVDPVGTPAYAGAEGVRTFWDTVHAAAEGELKLVPQDVFVCGAEAAMVFAIEIRGAAGGVRLHAVDVFELDENARIRRLKAYWEMDRAQPF